MVSHGGLRESKIGGNNESNGMPLQTVLAKDRLSFKQLIVWSPKAEQVPLTRY